MKPSSSFNPALLLCLIIAVFYSNIPVHAKKVSKNPADQALFLNTLDDLLNPRNAKGIRKLNRAELRRLKKETSMSATDLKGWALRDYQQDGTPGTSTQQLYTLLKKGAFKKTVVVAVIDSGVDIQHEDLKDNIWTNTKEIPGNGIDDDGNGYIDDVHGWNFLGNHQGQNVDTTSMEVTREYSRLKKENEGGAASTDQAKYYQKIKQSYFAQKNAIEDKIKKLNLLLEAYSAFKNAGLKDESVKGLDAFPVGNDSLEQYRYWLRGLFELKYNASKISNSMITYQNQLDTYYNTNFTSWENLIDDNPQDLNYRYYGNNDVTGPDATHGTHVAGIIGAIRNNGLGIDGQAQNIKIMPIRAVPDGDERDQDIANAIYYAVNNGADIINMSFGKAYSPHKELVDEAVLYAQSKGVLLVHAAGNESKNTDPALNNNYPTRHLFNGQTVENWLEVGASHYQFGVNLPAMFSNYGFNSVDLFAPGVAIYSTVPGNNYESLQGTSMASPEVAGVAALLLSLFPKTSPEKMRSTLMSTAQSFKNVVVILPGGEKNYSSMIPFGELSSTGGIVNALNAYYKLMEK